MEGLGFIVPDTQAGIKLWNPERLFACDAQKLFRPPRRNGSVTNARTGIPTKRACQVVGWGVHRNVHGPKGTGHSLIKFCAVFPRQF